MKKLISLILCFCFVLVFGNIAHSEYTPEDPLVIRIGFLNAPDDSSVESARIWKDMLKEESNGRIKLEIYPSGELGQATEEYQAMLDGSLHMASLIPGTIARFDKRYELITLPGLFTDDETAVEFTRGDGFIGKKMDEYYEENGIMRLVKGEPNFYSFFTTEDAGKITSIDDMKDKKLRVTESPLLTHFFKEADATPTSMPWGEIYTGLQRNTIDGTVGNLVWSVAAKFHEAATVISMIHVQYTPSDWLFSKKAWDEIPSDLQNIILDTVPEIQEIAEKNWKDEVASNKKMLKEEGVTIVEPTEEEQEEWQKQCYQIWKDYAKDVWGDKMVNRIENEIININ